jgi:putative spermidine/putrescine transport system substrate-binding protein
VPTGNLLGIDASASRTPTRSPPLFTKGELAGKKVGDQGTAPKKVMYLEKREGKKFAASPTQWMTLIPTTYNADTLGIRPDLIKRPIDELEGTAEPRVQGQGLDPEHPLDRHHGRGDGGRGHGQVYKYPDKGNMTKAEIDLTIAT